MRKRYKSWSNKGKNNSEFLGRATFSSNQSYYMTFSKNCLQKSLRFHLDLQILDFYANENNKNKQFYKNIK